MDREKIKQEMSDRQIKRVSESVLMDAAFQTGRKLVSKTENVLLKKLRNFPETIPLDSVIDQAAFPGYDKLIVALLDSLNRKSGHRVGLIGLNLKNIHPDTSAIEKQLLDAYQQLTATESAIDFNTLIKHLINAGAAVEALEVNQGWSEVHNLNDIAAIEKDINRVQLNKREKDVTTSAH